MPTIFNLIVLVLSLGIDTLLVSVSLGFRITKGKVKIAIVFACAEALMPLMGLLIGKAVGVIMGNWASLAGGILLLCVAVWLIVSKGKDENDEEGEDKDKSPGSLTGWALIATAGSISLDGLAVGFSMGLVGVPVALTTLIVALQAFVFTLLGLTFGSKLKPLLGRWSEHIVAVIFGLLGLWIIIEGVLKMESAVS